MWVSGRRRRWFCELSLQQATGNWQQAIGNWQHAIHKLGATLFLLVLKQVRPFKKRRTCLISFALVPSWSLYPGSSLCLVTCTFLVPCTLYLVPFIFTSFPKRASADLSAQGIWWWNYSRLLFPVRFAGNVG